MLVSMAVYTQQLPIMKYEIDVLQNLDTFQVSLDIEESIARDAEVFQFAATAPGTYQTMNIGRFVSNFKAYDKKGNRLDVAHESVNQFSIAKPHKISKITYSVAETFDTKVREFPIYLMCGSSIEEDHTLINPHTILGYFEGYQQNPLEITLKGNKEWGIGTALPQNDGVFYANTFDKAVDSPILAGKLTFADTTIAATHLEIFTYSENDKIHSSQLLDEMYDMLNAADDFLVDLPVERYTFLYLFEQNPYGTTGAWEHSYSSEYVMKEKNPTQGFLEKVTDIASHEFFHIVTPLNIHSEIIEEFDFVNPTPSIHLWMYEGVTEWASNILLFRGGIIDEEAYLQNAIAQKIIAAENYYDTEWSLAKIAKESFNGGEGARQYGNVYNKGSLVAGLLDIRLLELSDGQYGLRELILDLIEQYGIGKPVSEKTFFEDLVNMTYPEIEDFFNHYILSSEPLPYESYFSKIGLLYESKNNGMVKISTMKEMTESQKMLYEAWKVNLPANVHYR